MRPILSSKCFFCHGPDEETREAGLRLDLAEAAVADLGGYAAIVVGDPHASEAIARANADDPEWRMPPPDSGKSLSSEEIATLSAWIEQGAEYQPHWAFEPITRPALPGRTAANPIDRFVRERLDEAGLQPAPQADPYALIRRVSLDLTGLPPTVEEADAFAANPSDAAYEAVVDRLLASPHYGERWARRWLDLARYSDTKGYEKDRPRSIWPYRDWVIDAINADLPFDRFTIEQIAGDMLPEPTLDQLIATGFHRNTMTNEEGGIDPQEFRFLSIVDRVNTTGTTWLGLTIGCAQCHTHKYDPITHTDYYALFALLNNAEEPSLPLPSAKADAADQRRLDAIAELERSLQQRYEELAAEDPETPPLREAVDAWGEQLAKNAVRWSPVRPERVETNLPAAAILGDHSVSISGDVTNADRYEVWLNPRERTIAAIRLETLPDPRLPGGGSGRRTIDEAGGRDEGSFLLTELEAHVVGSGESRPLELTDATATFVPPELSAQMAIDGRPDTGWTVVGRQRERQTLVVRLAEPLRLLDGEAIRVTLRHESFYPAGLGRFRLSVTDEERPAVAIGLPDEVSTALVGGQMTADQEQALTTAFLESTPVLESELTELHRLRNKRVKRDTTLVLRERANNPRVTHRRHRGEYLKPREEVAPGTPGVLPGLPEGGRVDRLALARWLVDRGNPLTPRVVVNRHWQALFGVGLVKTVDDFGLQGESPSHPELLDWLASEFVRDGWSRKKLHRLIVTSATYRQSSVNHESQRLDPENRLLARASRRRLEAELVRDVVLASSGLLSEKIGGPSVFPSQPPGVTEAAYGPLSWVTSQGEDRYRRGMYTFNKRTAPYAAFGLFDGPSGETCVARRDRSNTPLQALATLNDKVTVEASRALARILIEGASTDEERASLLLQRCLTRPPEADEVHEIASYVAAQRERLALGEIDASRLLNAGPTVTWGFASTPEGWLARKDASVTVEDGALVVQSTGGDPFIGVEAEAPAGPFTLEVTAKQSTDGPLEVYWTTLDEPAESPERRRVVTPERDVWQSHRFEFEAAGPLRSLRIDPGSSPGVARIDAIKLTYGDGLFEITERDDPAELAAWMLAARVVLNLDEVITRP